MKFTVATAAFMATSAMAAPSAEPWCRYKGQSCWKREAAPKAEPWCHMKGQSCWKAKREAEAKADPWCHMKGQSCWKRAAAADAFAEAIMTSGGLKERTAEAEFSNAPGGAAFKAKRQLNELAALVARTEEDPEGYYAALGLEDEFDGDTEGQDDAATTDDTKEKRDASPWCHMKGQSCWKRSAIPEPEAEPWCHMKGQSCWKRDANPDAEAEAWCRYKGQSCWKVKRSEAEAYDKRWCHMKGQSCWKAKRAAEAVLEAIAAPDAEAFDTKPFDPAHFAKRDAEPWCHMKGQSCWKRDANAEADPEPWCMRPGGSCMAAKRDVEAVASVARGILES